MGSAVICPRCGKAVNSDEKLKYCPDCDSKLPKELAVNGPEATPLPLADMPTSRPTTGVTVNPEVPLKK